MSEIDISGLNKAEVLAALYNASHPQGMGFVQYDPNPMTLDEAQEILTHQTYFDYLKGRVMKISLEGDILSTGGYDYDNGPGAAQAAIDAIKSGDGVSIEKLHKTGTRKAIHDARRSIGEPIVVHQDGQMATLRLGLSDMSDVVAPKVDEAEESLNDC